MDVTRIPKIELHLHLDGAVPPETMWRMAQEKHVSLPVDTLDEFYAWLVKTADCRDVNTYLARFELPLQLMQDAPGITRITCDVLTTLARQGHIYDELRFAPQLHTRAGLRQQDAIEAVLAGREQALRAFPDYRCGILLCCMCIGPETANMAENLETVRLTQEYLGSGVVGMDLAGAEGIVPLRNFHPIFDLARELGLPFTCHAGDSQGPDTVRDALEFGAKRIGAWPPYF
ncbi:MAG: adenosine deaminase family protein [Oscillospiraceae bacterium]